MPPPDIAPPARTGLLRARAWFAVAAAVAGLLLVAYWVGDRNPAAASVTTATCDTGRTPIRCYPEGEDVAYVVVHRDGLWQDSQHVWRRGVPECLRDGGEDVGPVSVAVVEGSDDGMSWKQVVWVGCP